MAESMDVDILAFCDGEDFDLTCSEDESNEFVEKEEPPELVEQPIVIEKEVVPIEQPPNEIETTFYNELTHLSDRMIKCVSRPQFKVQLARHRIFPVDGEYPLVHNLLAILQSPNYDSTKLIDLGFTTHDIEILDSVRSKRGTYSDEDEMNLLVLVFLAKELISAPVKHKDNLKAARDPFVDSVANRRCEIVTQNNIRSFHNVTSSTRVTTIHGIGVLENVHDSERTKLSDTEQASLLRDMDKQFNKLVRPYLEKQIDNRYEKAMLERELAETNAKMKIIKHEHCKIKQDNDMIQAELERMSRVMQENTQRRQMAETEKATLIQKLEILRKDSTAVMSDQIALLELKIKNMQAVIDKPRTCIICTDEAQPNNKLVNGCDVAFDVQVHQSCAEQWYSKYGGDNGYHRQSAKCIACGKQCKISMSFIP